MKTLLGFLLLISICTIAFGHDGKTSGVREYGVFKTNMLEHFREFDEARHPRDGSLKALEDSRQYLIDQFKLMGMEPELNCFNTTVSIEHDEEKLVEGCNIIGTSKGASSSRNIMIIGADYDSSGSEINNNPLRNNGAGISLLLEVAMAYKDSWKWKGHARNYTVIFVAFDLNTKEQFPESDGHPGSYFFVNDYLNPILQRLGGTNAIKGTVILDSVASYNTDPNSQTLPADFYSIFPEAYERIVNSSKTGDYIGVYSTNDKKSSDLTKTFSGHYRMDRMRRPYRLQEMIAVTEGFGAGSTYRSLNHQATYNFWSASDPLPAILITDTGDDRVPQSGEDCSSSPHDCNYIFANEERMTFLYSTYAALSYTLLDEQATYVGYESGASLPGQSAAVIAAAAALLFIANLIH